MGILVDKTNNRYGRLLVVSRAERHATRRDYYWNCLCDCGKQKKILDYNLVNGKTNSCGCLKKQKLDKPKGTAATNSLYAVYRYGAKSRKYSFELTKEDFIKFIQGNCVYCGLEPSTVYYTRSPNGTIKYNGIDRVDCTKGYILDNCVSCCKMCNLAKKNYKLEDWYAYIDRLVKFNTKEKK